MASNTSTSFASRLHLPQEVLHPEPEELATPWAPQPIAWQHPDRQVRHSALRSQIDNPALTHLVREVRVRGGQPGRLTRETAGVLLGRADEEFVQLNKVGIRVIAPEWHIIDGARGLQVLARVAIIDTAPNPPAHLATTALSRLDTYHELRVTTPKLSDISDPQNILEQCIFGVPRGQEGKTPVIHLVDIEPIFPYEDTDDVDTMWAA